MDKAEAIDYLEVIVDYPPNIDKIDAKLHVKALRGIIYTYDGKIYAPDGANLSYDLHEHERVHVRQHAAFGGSDPWWERYLEDVEFRLDQELEAYRVQLAYINEHYNRKQRRDMLDFIANSLASSMYGNLLSRKAALKLLKQ